MGLTLLDTLCTLLVSHMISAPIVQGFSVSAPYTGSNINCGCTDYVFVGMNQGGLENMGVRSSLEDCVEDCRAKPECVAVDYNKIDQYCFHINDEDDPYIKQIGWKPSVTHVIIDRCNGNCSCRMNEIYTLGQMRVNLDKREYYTMLTEEQCYNFCRADEFCYEAGYNLVNGDCFHAQCAYTHPREMIANESFSHLKFNDRCTAILK